MSSKEQKTPNEQVSEEMEQHAHHDDTLPEAAEGVDLRDARIAELEAQLAEAQQHERDSLLRAKAEAENIRRRAELDVEKAHKFALEKFSGDLLPVIDNLERALDLADKNNPELAAMIAEFREEEREHRDAAFANGAERAPAYPLLAGAIRLGCRIAIRLSERV